MKSWHDSPVPNATEFGTDLVSHLSLTEKAYVGAGFIPARLREAGDNGRG